MLENEAIFEVIRAVWFSNGNDSLGITQCAYFSPFPVNCLAYVLTVVCAMPSFLGQTRLLYIISFQIWHCLSVEWKTGEHKSHPFVGDEANATTFQAMCDNINGYASFSPATSGAVDRLLQSFYERGR